MENSVNWVIGISVAGLCGVWLRVLLVSWLAYWFNGDSAWLIVGIVNVVGCLLMGGFYGAIEGKPDSSYWLLLKAPITLGFLGGFTTFSSFAWDAFTLYQQWRNTAQVEALTQVACTLLLQPVLGLCAVGFGFWGMKHLLYR
jgi:CrcB protein